MLSVYPTILGFVENESSQSATGVLVAKIIT
jgi:hypothetical protein